MGDLDEKFIATVYTMTITVVSSGNFTSLNNSIVLYARYAHNFASDDNDEAWPIKADERSIFPRDDQYSFVCSCREKDFNHNFLALSSRIVGATISSCVRRRQQKRGRNATYMYLACNLFEKKCSIQCSRLSLLFSFYLVGVDWTRWTYANSERTMKVITFKFGWLIFIPVAQLPPGFHSDFFSLSCRMIAEDDDNDLLYHSLLRGSKKVPCVTSFSRIF